MNLLLILLAVAGVAVYDYFHDKTIIKKPGAWIKYVVGLGVGLGYAVISSLPFFPQILQIGVVIVGCILWGVISNAVVSLYNKYLKKTPTTTTVGKV